MTFDILRDFLKNVHVNNVRNLNKFLERLNHKKKDILKWDNFYHENVHVKSTNRKSEF